MQTPKKKLHALQALTLGLLSSSVLALIGCGKQEFSVAVNEVASDSPGSYVIPAKIDLLLVLDDTGSAVESAETMRSVLSNLMNQVAIQNAWDYRIATVPLTTYRTISRVVASRYDSNWGSEWLPPFPGAVAADHRLPLGVFDRISSYGGLYVNANSSLGGNEPGLITLVSHLSHPSTHTNFLRTDALLSILMIGNGNDTSNFPSGGCMNGGIPVPCSEANLPANAKVEHFRTQIIQGAKGSLPGLTLEEKAQQIRFYSLVAHQTQTNCRGSVGTAQAGTRYRALSSLLNGQSYDYCSQSFESAIGLIAQDLNIQRMNYRTRYVFAPEEPVPSTIKVFKRSGGIETELAESMVNGWSYEGFKTVYTIDLPFQMNLATGWAIKLNGSAALIGDDTARVEFKPANP
jgi:hypothetical protein